MTLDQILRETEAHFDMSESGCVAVDVRLVPAHRRPDFFHLKDYVVSSQCSEQYFMVPRHTSTKGTSAIGDVADKTIGDTK